MKESELFGPIRDYFEAYGYRCDGEVGQIDLYMQKDGVSVAVELKVTLDFKAVRQAALRQRVADTVFIGICRSKRARGKEFSEKLYLLRRLGIGLITVSPSTGQVEIVSEPVISGLEEIRARNKRKRAFLEEEFRRRVVRGNTGGVNQGLRMTGYREDALRVLDALSTPDGEENARQIHRKCGVKKTASILRNNYYGWFLRSPEGAYTLTDAGRAALTEYADTLEKLRNADGEEKDGSESNGGKVD